MLKKLVQETCIRNFLYQKLAPVHVTKTVRFYWSVHSAAFESFWKKVKADIALHGNPISELRDVTCHMGSHSVICHPTQVNAPRLTPAMQAGTRFTYPGGTEGWVDLVDLIAPQPGVEPATFRSRVRRRTAAPPRQPGTWNLHRIALRSIRCTVQVSSTCRSFLSVSPV